MYLLAPLVTAAAVTVAVAVQPMAADTVVPTAASVAVHSVDAGVVAQGPGGGPPRPCRGNPTDDGCGSTAPAPKPRPRQTPRPTPKPSPRGH